MKIIQPILFLSLVMTIYLATHKKNFLTKAFSRIGLLLIFAVIAITIFNPDFLQKFASLLGVGRGADLLVYMTALGLFASSLLIFVKIREVERKVTRIVREIALKDLSGKEGTH